MGSSAGLTGKVWGVLCDCRLLLQGLRGWWAGAAWPVKGGPWGPQEGQQGVCQGGVTPPRPPRGGRAGRVGEERGWVRRGSEKLPLGAAQDGWLGGGRVGSPLAPTTVPG